MPNILEDEFIQENRNFIEMHAKIFLRRSGLKPPSYWYDDVLQETATAFLLWHRKAQERGVSPEMECAAAPTIIHRALSHAFVDRDGIGVTRRTISHRCAEVAEAKERRQTRKDSCRESGVRIDRQPDIVTLFTSSEDFGSVYIRDWLDALSPSDRELVMLLVKGYGHGDILSLLGITSRNYYTRRNRIRKEYDERCADVISGDVI